MLLYIVNARQKTVRLDWLDLARLADDVPVRMRQAFHKYLDEHWNSDYPLPATVDMDGEQKPIRWLIYRLWNCPDALPRHYYDLLELSGPHSFAAAACRVARELPADPTDDRKYRNTG